MEKSKRRKAAMNMLEGSIWDKILLFALPLALSSILQQLFNSADVAVVGRFAGSDALAAVGANGSVINLMVNLFVGLSVGSNVVISTRIGRQDEKGVSRAVHTSVLVALLSGIFLAVAGFLIARPVLHLIATPDNILDAAVLYFRIYFAGMPFIMLYNFTSAILRSKGDTKRPLYALFAAGILNVILNLFFVVVCHMGVEGVAIATVLSNVCSSTILTYLLAKEDGAVRLSFRKLGFDFKSLSSIANIGIPAGLQSMMFSIANVVVQASLNSLGSTAIAGSAAALNYEYFVYFLIMGFSQATVTFVGQNYGAGNKKRCRQILRTSFLLCESFTLVMITLFLVFRHPLSMVFTSDADVAAYALIRMGTILTFEFFNAAIEVISAMLRGMGHSAVPAVICICGICGVRLLWIFTIYRMTGTFAMLMRVYPISWGLTASILLAAYLVIMKKEK
jgi:putative MATE family efflux protein